MKIKYFFVAILAFFSTALSAHWQLVGNAEYTWGPFHVYSVGLFSETGSYQENQSPLMFSIKYEKPIEGKNFAITLIKEMEAQQFDTDDTTAWLKKMQEIFPDFSPNDILNFVALENKGYFIANDTVLDHEFDRKFTQAFINIWLSPKSSFLKLQPQLLGKEKRGQNKQEFQYKPASEPFDEENSMPELPPNYDPQHNLNG
ncbi:hypothetical protein BKG96_04745 [Rodentibacter caecimuris]|uniref:Chalcone isomerase domain-containing protein n=1 Tax=Rodentibacter caecimuris TaxID=1796644 RepID=A0A1V3KSR8_9PAST|nr:chalcone isomerase family protein [Rodentibacter heylii]OOF57937.1 hypothetical protein BKK56_00910 [Rodentibacter genomosp. 2]OOF78852.1 hypothetical protein BKG96_04745 [Rodentibacter heylii]OOF80390.1 hypothetical protein BKG97_06815 [Rodentibacter heylii]